MAFSLFILNLFLVFADPPTARVPAPERTQEDQKIDDECAPRLNLSVDAYAKCVAEKGRAAEQRRLAAQRMMDINGDTPSPVEEESECNPSAAVGACMRASENAAQVNNPSSSESQIASALQACRAACNADSAQVLRNFLGACREKDFSQTKQAMLSTMNNCGVGSSATSTGSYFDAIKTSVAGIADTAKSYGSQALDWVTSFNETTGASAPVFSAFSTGASAPWGAVQDPFDLQAGKFVGEVVSTRNAEDSSPIVAEETLSDDTEVESTVRPVRRPDNLMADNDAGDGGGSSGGGSNGGGGNSGGSSSGSTSGSTQQVVTPVTPTNEPVSYQAGNFAGLQKAMSAPAGGVGTSSSMGGEASRSGGSSGGSFDSGFKSRPLNFAGSGQASPAALKTTESPVGAVPPSASVAGMDVAASGAGQRGGGGSFGDFAGGRMVAAASKSALPLPNGFAAPPGMRSDNYYRTPGSAGGRMAGRTVTPFCKGPNCRRTPENRGIAAANCDGNPQCLLALTGKLRGPGREPIGSNEYWETSGTKGRGTARGARGVASVVTKPGGVIRGKAQDVLNHLGNSKVFKLDHDGMLEVGL